MARLTKFPVLDPVTNKKSLKIVEDWMRTYEPDKLFDKNGTLVPELQQTSRRLGNDASPPIPTPLAGCSVKTSSFQIFAIMRRKWLTPGGSYAPPTDVLAHFLAEVMRRNMSSFRVFGPDETASNKLTAIYAASKKTWLAEYKPDDADGGELDVSGRVMEMLSEHTLEGWFEGYVLTGRHGFFSTYEAFVHVIDSMFNQHAKWLEKSKRRGWRGVRPCPPSTCSSRRWYGARITTASPIRTPDFSMWSRIRARM